MSACSVMPFSSSMTSTGGTGKRRRDDGHTCLFNSALAAPCPRVELRGDQPIGSGRARIFLHAVRDIDLGEELLLDDVLMIDAGSTRCAMDGCRGSMLAPSEPTASKVRG
jgi:hypothetical protein